MKDPHFDVAFSYGRFTVYWYAILLAAGIAVATIITDRRTKGRNVPKDLALDLCILGVPCGLVGARLFACLSGAVAWADFFDLTRVGLSYFGGAFLAAAAILTYVALRKVPVGEALDILAPGVFVGIAVAVWGDFFNRTHYGPLVEKASHKWFPLATFGSDLKIHYAAFFYEFLLCVLLVVLYYALLRKAIRRKGARFLVMTLLYCLGRFCIDSIREGLVMAGPIAFDQLCEIILAVLCLILLFIQPKKQPAEAEASPAAEEPAETAEEAPKVEEAPAAQPVPESEQTAAPEATQAPAGDDGFSGLN